MALPWKTFREDLVKKIDETVVSHAATRQIQGGLHAETAMGPTTDPGKFVVRRPLNKITIKNSAEIRDDKVRALVQERLKQFNGDAKKSFAQPLYHADGKTPIRKVRVLLNYNPCTLFGIQRENRAYRFYEYAKNHHMEIVQDDVTGKWSGIIITMMEAAKRVRSGKPVIQYDHGTGKTFIMDLCSNDMVLLHTETGKVVCRAQKLSTQITLREHNIAKIDKEFKSIGRYLPTPNSFKEYQPQKLQISPLGEITQITHIEYDQKNP
jgi:CRISPR-associated endonuclease Csn1